MLHVQFDLINSSAISFTSVVFHINHFMNNCLHKVNKFTAQKFPSAECVVMNFCKRSVLTIFDVNCRYLRRNRLSLTGNHALYLIINKRTIASMTETIGRLYQTEQDEDGFLYVTYTSQEAFGCCCCCSDQPV